VAGEQTLEMLGAFPFVALYRKPQEDRSAQDSACYDRAPLTDETRTGSLVRPELRYQHSRGDRSSRPEGPDRLHGGVKECAPTVRRFGRDALRHALKFVGRHRGVNLPGVLEEVVA
jgi:hypothetical protein